MMKVTLITLLFAAALVTAAPEVHYKAPPKPYNFAYGINDPYNGLDFGQDETSDGSNVKGSYTVQLPDGRRQTVTYQADHNNGYYAEVTYDGKAQYPSKSEHPPFVVPPHKGGGGGGYH